MKRESCFYCEKARLILLVGAFWFFWNTAASIPLDPRPTTAASANEAVNQVLEKYDWRKLASAGRLLGGVPVTVDGRLALKIENTSDMPLIQTILKIDRPAITSSQYALIGDIRYENVQGDGYLEMWNYFSPLRPGLPEQARLPEGQYFKHSVEQWAPPAPVRWLASVAHRNGDRSRFHSTAPAPQTR